MCHFFIVCFGLCSWIITHQYVYIGCNGLFVHINENLIIKKKYLMVAIYNASCNHENAMGLYHNIIVNIMFLVFEFKHHKYDVGRNVSLNVIRIIYTLETEKS